MVVVFRFTNLPSQLDANAETGTNANCRFSCPTCHTSAASSHSRRLGQLADIRSIRIPRSRSWNLNRPRIGCWRRYSNNGTQFSGTVLGKFFHQHTHSNKGGWIHRSTERPWILLWWTNWSRRSNNIAHCWLHRIHIYISELLTNSSATPDNKNLISDFGRTDVWVKQWSIKTDTQVKDK